MVQESLLQLLLITAFQQDRWVQLVQQAAAANNLVLVVADPDDVVELAASQAFQAAAIDSATVPDTTALIITLRSLPTVERIVVFTTAPSWRQAREVYQAGADDYQFKSYDVQELGRVID